MAEHVRAGLSADAVGRTHEWSRLVDFATSGLPHSTLGLVWGRRRIGKSFLLSQLGERYGLYFQAVRGTAGEALAELGTEVARVTAAPGSIYLPDWATALSVLMQLGADGPFTVVLDEYPYLREETPELDSMIQRIFGTGNALRESNQCRLVLCGSAVSVMSQLLSGSSPLRGRAGLDLRIAAFDYRDALALHRTSDLDLAVRLYSIIGGVAAYARDMVDDDLPTQLRGLDSWVARRVLSPAAPLSREVDVLLSDDPTMSQTRKIHQYHATLAAVALGRRTPGRIADYVKMSGPRLDPMLRTLVDAQFIDRLVDPVRDNRPTYHPADPIVRFHYALVRPHQTRLSRYGADLKTMWGELSSTFTSKVVGPTFESMARHWLHHYADLRAFGGGPFHIGSTVVTGGDDDHDVDLVVALDDAERPGDRTVVVLGEAKSGEEFTLRHLERLESIRDATGPRARDAALYLVGRRFSSALASMAATRRDVELVDLERLYYGS